MLISFKNPRAKQYAMTFWFCYTCKRTWHSYIQTPQETKRIRCFFCMKGTSMRLKDDKHRVEWRYGDYDKEMRAFKKINRKKSSKANI